MRVVSLTNYTRSPCLFKFAHIETETQRSVLFYIGSLYVRLYFGLPVEVFNDYRTLDSKIIGQRYIEFVMHIPRDSEGCIDSKAGNENARRMLYLPISQYFCRYDLVERPQVRLVGDLTKRAQALTLN